MVFEKSIRNYFQCQFFRHFLMVSNMIMFFFISFITFTFDAVSPFNYLNIVFVTVFILITILYLTITKTKPRVCLFSLCCIGLLLCFFMSFSVHGFSSFPKTPVLITIFSLFAFIWLQSNKRHISLYLFAFLLASWCFLFAFSFFEIDSIIRPNFSKRIGSFFGNQNDVARHLVFSLLINLYYAFSFKKKILKVFLYLIVLFCSYLVLLTGSISNLLLVAVLLFVYAFLVSNHKSKSVYITVFLIMTFLLLLSLFIFPVFSPIKNRIMSIVMSLFGVGNSNYDSSTIGRLNAAIYGFKLFLSSPLFGSGYNGVVNNYKIMAHNNLAEIAADYGLFALIFEETLILFPLFAKTRISTKHIVLVKTAIVYLAFVQLFLVVFNSKIEAIVLPLIYIVLDRNEPINSLSKTRRCSNFKYRYFEANI